MLNFPMTMHDDKLYYFTQRQYILRQEKICQSPFRKSEQICGRLTDKREKKYFDYTINLIVTSPGQEEATTAYPISL